MTDDFDYTLYSDASHFPGREYCGWAFVLLVGDDPAIEGCGRIESDSVMRAELHAVTQGLAARANLHRTLVLVDIAPNDVLRFVPERLRINAHVQALSAKGNHRWHVHCHSAARRLAKHR